jgi:KDO2-lipid IV(A) lauroyltransferase
MSFIKALLKKVKYLAVAIVAVPFVIIIMILPYKFASYVGGVIGSILGHFLNKMNVVIEKNLYIIFPNIDRGTIMEKKRIFWNNIGRTIAESINLRFRAANRVLDIVSLVNKRELEELLNSGSSIIFISCHYGNWELMPLYAKLKSNRKLGVIFKKTRSRIRNFAINLIRKVGKDGLVVTYSIKDLVELVRNGDNIGMLIDQKTTGTVSTSFFNKEIKVSSIPLDIASKYGCKVVMIRTYRSEERHKMLLELGPRFSCSSKEDVITGIRIICSEFENWIKEKPEEWLLSYDRWAS